MKVSTATDNVTFISRIKVLQWTVTWLYLFWLKWAQCYVNETYLCRIDQDSEGEYSHWQYHFYFKEKRFAMNSDIGFTCFDWHGQQDAILTLHICVTLTRLAKLSADTFNVTFYFGDKSFAMKSVMGFTCFGWHVQHNAIWTQHICVVLTIWRQGINSYKEHFSKKKTCMLDSCDLSISFI